MINLKGGENTKSKRLFIISIILVFLCLNVVSATGDIGDNTLGDANGISQDLLAATNENVLTDSEEGNFTELSNYISTEIAAGHNTIDLNKSYKFVDGESIITLDGSIIINGNGHKIDADKKTGIFSIKPVSGNQITLNNITFTNANSARGGAVDQAGDKNNVIDLTITNCKFINNTVSGSGGSVYSNSNTGDMIFENNTFINGTATACGAIYVSSNNVNSFYNNTFINNTALNGNAGAVQVGANVVVNKSKFINNKAAKQGGAIYAAASNLNVLNSEFVNNSARTSEGGAIYAGGKGLKVNSSKFENNVAQYGGAISSHSANSNITYSNFTNNTAKFEKTIDKDGPRGAGIYFGIAADNSIVSNCNFELNKVLFDNNRDHLGAGVYIGSDNVNVTDSSFKNNSAAFGGGIYSAQGANNTIIKNSNFTDNYAQDTGAGVSSVGGNPTVSYCNFINNSADLNAGGLYVDLRNADEGAKGNEGYVSNCNFTGNYAYASGGGIHLRDRDSQGFTVVISDCLFENNTANIGKIKDIRGGGAVSLNGPANITDCEFNGNNATRGSAIRLAQDKSTTKLYLENTVFGKNRANSTNLIINIDKPISYYPSNVTINVTLFGWDNIANAIWNEKTSGYVYTSNITYEAFIDGELVTLNTPVGFKETVNGYKNSNNGDLVWQDTRENAQNLTLEIYKVENGVLGECIDVINAPLTDLSGTLSNIQKSLKPGNYTAKASHSRDAYYTEIETQADFEIIDVLNITKTTEDFEVFVGDNVTYNITVSNTGNDYITNIVLNDTIPDGFELLNYSTTWNISPELEETLEIFIKNLMKEDGLSEKEAREIVYAGNGFTNWTYDGKLFRISNTQEIHVGPDLPSIKAESVLRPNCNVTLTLVFKATKNGTYNNTVTLTTDQTNEINTTSVDTLVKPIVVNLTVEKSADKFEGIKINDDLVNFTITVTNNGPCDAHNVTVTDNMVSALDIQTVGNETLTKREGNKIVWTIPSLANQTSASVWVVVKALMNGVYTNTAVVNCDENKTNKTDDVKIFVEPAVEFEIIKTAAPNNVTVGENVTFTITVKNLGPSNATDVEISDVINTNVFKFDGTSATKIGEFTYVDNTLKWIIKELENASSISVSFNVTTIATGNYTNIVSVTSKENKTGTSNKTNVTVNKAPSLVNGTNVTVTFGDEIKVNYNSTNATDVIYEIFDSEGNSVAKGTVGPDGTIKVEKQLPVGNYTVNWTTKVDANHTPATNTSSITVLPAPSTVEGEDQTVTYGEAIEVPVTSVNATDVVYQIIDENGTVVKEGSLKPGENITGLNLSVGTYTVNLTAKVDGNHTPSNNTCTIVVNPAPSAVEGKDVNVTYGDEIKVDYNSTNATNVTYEIYDGDKLVDNGTVGPDGVIPVEQLPVGNYTVKWTTIVDGNHTENYNESSITVNPAPSVVEGEDQTVTYGEAIEVPVTSVNATSIEYQIIDKDGNVVAKGNLTPGENITGLDLAVGTYTVNLTAKVDGNHTPSNNTCTIVVNPAPSVVEGKDVNVTYGDEIKVDYNSTNATNVTYEIYDGDKLVDNGTVGPDGVIPVEQLPVGNYTVKWTTIVDGNHTENYNQSSITVNPAPSTVQGENQTVTYGDPIVVPVTSENATEVTYKIVDENGTVVKEGNLTPGENITGLDLPVGNYTVNLTTVVDGNHTPATNTSSITVLPAPSVVEGENQTVTYGEPIVVPVTSENATEVTYKIVDENGTVVKEGNLTPGEPITGLDLPVGNYTVNLTTVVDGNHTPATNSSTITVLPAPSTVEGENQTVTYGEPIVVPVTSENATEVTYKIVDENGTVVKEGNLTPGENITGLDLPVGNYTVELTTVVDGNHTPATNSSTITVLPAPSTVEGENQTVTYGDPIVVPVTSENATEVTYKIVDENGTVVKEGNLTPGENITGLDLPVGNYTVNLTTVVDGNHTSATNTSSITVLPAPSVVEGENQTVTYGDPIVVPVSSENATEVTYKIVDENGTVVKEGNLTPGENITGLDLPVGNYTVNLTTVVDGNHTSATNTSSITVLPAPSVVEGENQTVTYGEPIVVPVTSENATEVTYKIVDENGTVVKEGNLTPGEPITGLDLPVGNYTVELTTVVDGNHTPATNSSTITVLPAPSVVEGENQTVTYGDPIVVPVTSENATEVTYKIVDENGTVVKEGNLTPGENITGLDLPVGNYTVNLTTVVDGNHTPVTNTSSITVLPAPSVVEGENQTVTYGEPIVVPVTSENATEVTYKIVDENGTVVKEGNLTPGEPITGLDLPVGNYTVELTTVVDGNHTPATNSSTITVLPAPSTVEGENQTVTYGEPIVVPVSSENATEITYKIVDEDGNVVTNGTIKPGENITGLDLPVGNYTVELTTVVDGNHTSATNSSTITVLPAPSTVEGENRTVTYGEPIVVPVSSENATEITYKIVDEDGNVVTNGTFKPGENITGLDLPVGNYTVELTTVVDGNHTSATNTSSITVLPAPSVVEGENQTVTYGDPIVVPVSSENATEVTYKIVDENGTVVKEGNLTPGENITGLDLPVGNYTVELTTVVDGNHTSATNTSSITVLPAPSVVEGENQTVTYGDPIVVPVSSENATEITYKIIDEDGNVVANGTINPGEDITAPELPVGNYTVELTTVVDGNHTPATNSSTIEVLPIPTKVTIGNVTTYPGENVTIPINVTTINDEPFNGDVAVILPDNSTQIVSVVNGTGNITWIVPEDYTPDKYPDAIRFPGNETYAPSNGTGTVTVIQVPTHVSVENVTVYPDTDVSIQINVTADNNNPINGEVVITMPDGSNVTVDIVNGTGTAKWHVPADYTPDVYPDTVRFAGDKTYLPSSGNGTITVIKDPSAVIGEDVSVNVGEPIVVPVTSENATEVEYTIIDKDGKVVANGTVKHGEDISLPDGLPAGNYTVNLTTVVDPQHTPATNTCSIEVKKILPPVNVDAPTITVGEDGVITVTVPEDATGTITIEVEGKSYTAPVKDGKAVFHVPGLKVGTHGIKAYYSGDDKYLPNNSTGTIDVLPKDEPVPEPAEPTKSDKPVKTGLAKYETGNPVLVLLMVLSLLGVSIKRRK